jgi:hypothetical protein
MKLIKKQYILGLIFILTMATTSVYAAGSQITFPDDVDDEGPQVPIDGFVVLGIAAGAYLGFKKHKENKI